MDKLLIINKMKYLLFYALLLIAAMSYGQGLLKEENIPQNSKQTVYQTRKYDKIEKYSEGLAVVKRRGKYGFIDRVGKEVTPIKYGYA